MSRKYGLILGLTVVQAVFQIQGRGQTRPDVQVPAWYTRASETAVRSRQRDSLRWTGLAQIADDVSPNLKAEDLAFAAAEAGANSRQDDLALFILARRASDQASAAETIRKLLLDRRMQFATFRALTFSSPDVAKSMLDETLGQEKLMGDSLYIATAILEAVGDEKSLTVLKGRVQSLRSDDTWKPSYEVAMLSLETSLRTPQKERVAKRQEEIRFLQIRCERPKAIVEYDDYGLVAQRVWKRGERFSSEFLLGKLRFFKPAIDLSQGTEVLDAPILAIHLLGHQREATAVQRLTELLYDVPTPTIEALARIGNLEAVRALVIADPKGNKISGKDSLINYGDQTTLDALAQLASDMSLSPRARSLARDVEAGLRVRLGRQ